MRKKEKTLLAIAISLGSLYGCIPGAKYLPYVNCNFGDCAFDDFNYNRDHNDGNDGSDCEWYLWPINCL